MRSQRSRRGRAVRELDLAVLKPRAVSVVLGGQRPLEKKEIAAGESAGLAGGFRWGLRGGGAA